MTLEILIPQYTETEEIIKPLLDSIAIQQGVNLNDINVIIVNDGTNVILDDTFLESYPFHIDYYLKDHGGLSETRNFLLDRAGADYIMHCDADDMFISNLGLYTIFSEIKKGEFDFFFPDFLVESRDSEDNPIYNVMTNQSHVHGKVLRRQFLIDNDIHWKNELTMHECRYFHCLCETLTTPDRIRYYKQPFYLWKYNPNSMVHQTTDWFLKTYGYFTLSLMYLIEELLRRGKTQAAASVAFSYIYLTYFFYNSESWLKEENQPYVENALKSYISFYKKYNSLANLLEESKKQLIIKEQRNNTAKSQTTPYLETITFPQFIEKVKMITIN